MQNRIEEGRRFNFTIIENDIIDNVDKYNKSEVLAYMVLARYANNNTCYPSYNTIASKMRCSKRTAIDAINSLVEKGVITKEIRKADNSEENNTNVYKITGEILVNGVADNIQKQREERAKRQKQLKELNSHQNVKYVREYAPHIRLGREQKLDLIEWEFGILEEALGRAMLYGAKTFKYLVDTYYTVLEEIKNIDQGSVEEEDSAKDNITDFVPRKEFKKTEMHQVAYINYIEKGFDALTDLEVRYLVELEEAGIIDLSMIGD